MRCATLVILLVGVLFATTPAAAQSLKDKALKDKALKDKIAKDKKKDQPSEAVRNGLVGGKTLYQWLKLVPSKDPSMSEMAIKAIQAWPPPDVYTAGGLKVLLDELAKYQPQKKIYLDTTVRVNLAMALGNILGGALDSKETTVLSKDSLRAVERLTLMLEDPQEIVKLRAVEALGRLGMEANNKHTIYKVAELVKYWDPNIPNWYPKSDTWEVRQAAALALGYIAKDPRNGPLGEAVMTLGNATVERTKGARIGEPTAAVRMAAVQSLTWLGGPPQIEHRKLMVRYFEQVIAHESDDAVRLWAHVAIMSIAYHVNEGLLVAPIGKILGSHKDQAVRIQAALALSTIANTKGDFIKGQVPILIKCLKDDDNVIVAWTIFTLAHMGDSGELAIPALHELMSNKELPEPLRKAAQGAIELMKTKKKTITPKTKK